MSYLLTYILHSQKFIQGTMLPSKSLILPISSQEPRICCSSVRNLKSSQGYSLSFLCFSLTTVHFDITPLAGFPTWKGRYVLCSLLTRQDGYFCCCDGVVLNMSSAGEGMSLLGSPNLLLPKMLPRSCGCTVLGMFIRGLG